jgi:hypothetical protein
VFEVTDYVKEIECLNCEKVKEAVTVTCRAGTFSGPLCASCLFREAKKRKNNAKKPTPQPNGQPVVHEFG